MTAVLTVLGALSVLRRCRARHATFRWVRCDLRHGHSGHQHHFGWMDIAGVPCDLDMPLDNKPASPATPGSYTVTVTPKKADQPPGWVEVSLGPVSESVRYKEYLVPRRRRWWRR